MFNYPKYPLCSTPGVGGPTSVQPAQVEAPISQDAKAQFATRQAEVVKNVEPKVSHPEVKSAGQPGAEGPNTLKSDERNVTHLDGQTVQCVQSGQVGKTSTEAPQETQSKLLEQADELLKQRNEHKAVTASINGLSEAVEALKAEGNSPQEVLEILKNTEFPPALKVKITLKDGTKFSLIPPGDELSKRDNLDGLMKKAVTILQNHHEKHFKSFDEPAVQKQIDTLKNSVTELDQQIGEGAGGVKEFTRLENRQCLLNINVRHEIKDSTVTFKHVDGSPTAQHQTAASPQSGQTDTTDQPSQAHTKPELDNNRPATPTPAAQDPIDPARADKDATIPPPGTEDGSDPLDGLDVEVTVNPDIFEQDSSLSLIPKIVQDSTENTRETDETGQTGNTGPTDDTGQTADTGPAGDTGQTADTEPTSDNGPAGDTGQTGETGQTGNTGPTGETGQTVDTGPTGETGQTVDTGPTGDTQVTTGQPAPPETAPDTTKAGTADSDTSALNKKLAETNVQSLKVDTSGGNIPSTNRAFKTSVNSIVSEVNQFNRDIARLEKEVSAPSINGDKEPNGAGVRQQMRGRINSLRTELDKTIQKFATRNKGDTEGLAALEKQVNKLKNDLAAQEQQMAAADQALSSDGVKTQVNNIPKFDATIDTPDDYLSDVLTHLGDSFQPGNSSEVANYVAGQTIKTATEELVSQCGEDIKGKTHDEQQQLYMDYSRKLSRLKPGNLHSRIHQGKLNNRGKQFASAAVKDAGEQLEALFNQGRTSSGHLDSITNPTQRDQAVRMIDDDRIRPMLLSLISSVKTTNEGITNSAVEGGVDSALQTGLLDIRDRFNLPKMPDMTAVLNACLDDLEKPNSKLAVESARQHRDTLTAKGDKTRHQKLTEQCMDLQNKLPESSAPNIPPNSLEMMETFQKPGGLLDAGALENKQSKREGSFQTRQISGGNTPLNKFFGDVSGASHRKTDGGAESIAIDGGKPAGITLEKNGAGEWHGMLGNKHYTVQPRLLYQHPEINIPFEGNWLPVKADDGKTGILVLQNTASESRYFLYEPGGDGKLKPKPIDTDSTSTDEIIEAEFFLRATAKSPNDSTLPAISGEGREAALDKADILNGGIRSISNKWGGDREKLASLHQQVCQEVKGQQNLKALISTENKSTDLNRRIVSKSQYSLQQEAKQARQATGSTLQDASLNPDLQRYETLSVDATFEKAGNSYAEQSPKQAGSDALVELGKKSMQAFKDSAFQQISAFQGCEIDPNANAGSEGSIQEVEKNVEKVVKVNRDRQLRLSQGVDSLTQKLGAAIRNSSENPKGLETFRNDELVDFAINNFKKGHLPAGVDTASFSDDLVQLMLVKNERDFSVGLGRSLDGLSNKLSGLKSAHEESLVMDDDEFTTASQQWNLDMALLASSQIEANARIQHYYSEGLTEQNRVMMTLEQGGLMLRGNQPDMAKEVFDLIEKIHQGGDSAEGQSLIFQLGTGYGKSKTVIPLAADQAFQKGLRARVIAPANNQAELDHSLHHYFADQGVDYHRLDIFKDYVEPAQGSAWWSTDNLKEILDTVSQKEPLGVSTEDVQVLMTLKDKLKATGESKEEVALLEKIVDTLQYDGVNIFDEYDRGVMPGRQEELNGLTSSMNQALAPLNMNSPIGSDEVAQVQSAFLSGSKNKVCLSATMGSGFTMAVLTDSTSVNEAADKFKSDPMTTNARFFNWLTKTTPIVANDTASAEGRVSILNSAMAQSGKDKQIILFDGNDAGESEVSRFENVKNDHQNLQNARGGESRGLLYYNANKELCLYDPQQEKFQEMGARVSPEMEGIIRKNPNLYDVRLDSTQGVGTDCPQSPDSIGIHMGMLEDSNRRSSLMVQEFGRFSRKSTNFRQQNFYMVVNPSAVSKSDSAETADLVEAFQSAHQSTETARDALLQTLGGQPTAQQQRVIKSILHVSPPSGQEPPDANLESDLDAFLDSWECKDFPESSKAALRNFKAAQWNEQGSFLEMMTGVMAQRENSEFVRQCEDNLEKGVMRSEADALSSQAHTWLGKGADKVMEGIDLHTAHSSVPRYTAPDYDPDVFVSELKQVLSTAIHEKLATVERQSALPGSSLEEVTKNNYTDQAIKDHIRDISENGITSVSAQTSGGVPPELLAHCQELKGQADSIFEKISVLCNDGKPLGKSSTGTRSQLEVTTGWKKMTELKASLDQQFEKLQAGDSAAAMKFFEGNKNTMQEFYQGLSKNISTLTFSEHFKNTDLFRLMCDELKPVMPELRDFKTADRRALIRGNGTGFSLVSTKRGTNIPQKRTLDLKQPSNAVMQELQEVANAGKSENARKMVKTALQNLNGELQPYLNQIENELLAANQKHRTQLIDRAERAEANIEARKNIRFTAAAA